MAAKKKPPASAQTPGRKKPKRKPKDEPAEDPAVSLTRLRANPRRGGRGR